MKLILPKKRSQEKGQVLLVLLLVISVILVVGLSVASRSVTDVKISQQSQESARALLVAQTGLEKAIKVGKGYSGTDVTLNMDYSVVKNDLGGIGKKTFIFPNPISANDFANVWLIDHDNAGNLSTIIPIPQVKSIIFAWGNEASSEKTALEATLIYKNGINFFNQRFVFDPDSTRRSSQTHFQDIESCSFDGTSFPYCSGVISLSGTPYLIRFRLLFNTTPQKIGVKSNDTANLPIQGSCYVSTATVKESKVTRRLQQCQLWPTVPSIFNYQLFSGGDLQ